MANPLNTLQCIKRLAKRIKIDTGIPHFAALDQAALRAGFANYAHAQRTLTDTSPSAQRQASSEPKLIRKLSSTAPGLPSPATNAVVQLLKSSVARGVAILSLADVAAAVQDSRPMSARHKLWLRSQVTRAMADPMMQGMRLTTR